MELLPAIALFMPSSPLPGLSAASALPIPLAARLLPLGLLRARGRQLRRHDGPDPARSPRRHPSTPSPASPLSARLPASSKASPSARASSCPPTTTSAPSSRPASRSISCSVRTTATASSLPSPPPAQSADYVIAIAKDPVDDAVRAHPDNPHRAHRPLHHRPALRPHLQVHPSSRPQTHPPHHPLIQAATRALVFSTVALAVLLLSVLFLVIP